MEKKKDEIRHCVVIRYIGLKGLAPKQVHQDMEATHLERVPLRTAW